MKTVLIGAASAALAVGVLAPQQANAQTGQTWSVRMDCASSGYARQRCAAPDGFFVRNVELAQRRSSATCTFNSDWGWDAAGVWVDNGCRAEFVLYADRDGSGGASTGYPTAGSGAGQTATITCFSTGTARRSCVTAEPIHSARLALQRSTVNCVHGSTWGFEEYAVWVSNGCGGDFVVNDLSDLGELPQNDDDGLYGGANDPGGYAPGDPYDVSRNLWTERGFSDHDIAVAACARRVMRAAWDDADFSAQFEGQPAVARQGYGNSFNTGGGYSNDWRVSGPIIVHNRSGFERYQVSCTVRDGRVGEFEAQALQSGYR